MATLSLDILDLPDHPFQPASFQFPLCSLGKQQSYGEVFNSDGLVVMVSAHSYLHILTNMAIVILLRLELKTSFFNVQ